MAETQTMARTSLSEEPEGEQWLLGADEERPQRAASSEPPVGRANVTACGGGGGFLPSGLPVVLDTRWEGGSTASAVPWCVHKRTRIQSPRLPPLGICRWAGRAATPLLPAPLMRRHRSVSEGLGTRAEKLVGDAYKEAHRKDIRTVFNLVRWKQHRSSKRYMRHMVGAGHNVPDREGGNGRTTGFDLPSKVGTR